MRSIAAVLIWLCAGGMCAGDANHAGWRQRVPEKTRRLTNPYHGQPAAGKAGEKLFGRYCSPCHGASRAGKRRAPDLRSPLVRTTAPGELFWLLRNGMLRQGMPSWSHLPEEQRWQIVTWLQTAGR